MNAHPYDNISNTKNISLKEIGKGLNEIREYLGYISAFSNIGVGLNVITNLAEPDNGVMASKI